MSASHPIHAVVIGGSAGAIDALLAILPLLPAAFSLPVVVVLHLLAGRPSGLAEVLRPTCSLRLKEADDKEPIVPGTLYLAPPSYHLLIERQRHFSLSVDELVNFSRPSIDVLFESAADAYGAGLAGVLLSGANDDGAEGLASIRKQGGVTIAQAPGTARVPTMPEAAICTGAAEHVLPLGEIGSFLAALGDPEPKATALAVKETP